MDKKYAISLEYCVPCDYSSQALAATNDLIYNYQHLISQFTLIHGTKGAFELKVDDVLLFSKNELKRHANPGEILELFKQHVGPDADVYPRG